MLYESYRRVDVKALLKDSKEFGKERRKQEREME